VGSFTEFQNTYNNTKILLTEFHSKRIENCCLSLNRLFPKKSEISSEDLQGVLDKYDTDFRKKLEIVKALVDMMESFEFLRDYDNTIKLAEVVEKNLIGLSENLLRRIFMARERALVYSGNSNKAYENYEKYIFDGNLKNFINYDEYYQKKLLFTIIKNFDDSKGEYNDCINFFEGLTFNKSSSTIWNFRDFEEFFEMRIIEDLYIRFVKDIKTVNLSKSVLSKHFKTINQILTKKVNLEQPLGTMSKVLIFLALYDEKEMIQYFDSILKGSGKKCDLVKYILLIFRQIFT
jgi:hypothetical protein